MMRALRFPPVWFTILFAVIVVGYQGWLSVGGARKLSEAGLADPTGRQNVEVVLGIAAEQFHMTRLQAAGRLVRFEDSKAFLMDVPVDRLRALARNYWVAEVRPWEGL